MPYYRLYLLDASDHIANVVEFTGPDDTSAMDKARALANGRAIDVCADARRVGRVENNSAEKDRGDARAA